MKKLITFLIFVLIVFFINFYQEEIKYEFYKLTYLTSNSTLDKPIYQKDLHLTYSHELEGVELNKKKDIVDAFYTALNSGFDYYHVYCNKNYLTCINDLKELSDDSNIFATVNNFVHPFNSFLEIKTKHDNFMNIKWTIKKLYNEQEIILLDELVNQLYNKLITSDMSERAKIKTIHDFIINNTEYDSKKTDNMKDTAYKSNTAYGVLFEKKGICSGYSDAMALFLEKMNIPNYKIASDKHVWNYVLVDGHWLHLDLTWDDPVTKDGSNLLSHTFFLITTDELLKLDRTEHEFNQDIYLY